MPAAKLSGLKHLLYTAAALATLALLRPVPGSSRSNAAHPGYRPERKETSCSKKIMYSLGALAVLAMAVGAGFKPN